MLITASLVWTWTGNDQKEEEKKKLQSSDKKENDFSICNPTTEFRLRVFHFASEDFSNVAQFQCSHKKTVPFFCLQELSDEIEEYTQRFNTEDQLEWNLVLQEVAAFVEVFIIIYRSPIPYRSSVKV